MIYLNIKEFGKTETLDEFETYKEAKEMRREYIIANMYYINSYLSARCTKEWKSND